jgi:hypothetical protein
VFALAPRIGASVLVDDGLAGDGERLAAAVRNLALLCTLPTRPRGDPDGGWSPFGPKHLGTIGFLEPDAAAAPGVVDAVAGRGTAPPPPAYCRTFGSRT